MTELHWQQLLIRILEGIPYAVWRGCELWHDSICWDERMVWLETLLLNDLIDISLYLTTAAIITIILGLFDQEVLVRIRSRVETTRVCARTRCTRNIATKLELLRLFWLLHRVWDEHHRCWHSRPWWVSYLWCINHLIEVVVRVASWRSLTAASLTQTLGLHDRKASNGTATN